MVHQKQDKAPKTGTPTDDDNDREASSSSSSSSNSSTEIIIREDPKEELSSQAQEEEHKITMKQPPVPEVGAVRVSAEVANNANAKCAALEAKIRRKRRKYQRHRHHDSDLESSYKSHNNKKSPRYGLAHHVAPSQAKAMKGRLSTKNTSASRTTNSNIDRSTSGNKTIRRGLGGKNLNVARPSSSLSKTTNKERILAITPSNNMTFSIDEEEGVQTIQPTERHGIEPVLAMDNGFTCVLNDMDSTEVAVESTTEERDDPAFTAEERDEGDNDHGDGDNYGAGDVETPLESLAVARPVQAMDDDMIGQATEWDPQHLESEVIQKAKRQQCCRIGGILMTISCLVLVIALSVYFTTRNSDGDNDVFIFTEAPTLAPTPIPVEQHVLNLLPDSTVKGITNSPTSPQNIAYTWLLDDPWVLSYPDWRLIQRFALATFFHATGGEDTWFNNTDWLDYEQHECLWWSSGSLTQFDSYSKLKWLPIQPPEFQICQNWTYSEEDEGHGGAYVGLQLVSNGLSGSIPDELFLLTSLKTLKMEINPELYGSLPSHLIGNLTNLRYLELTRTLLSSSIPSEIGLLSNLREFNIPLTQVTGTLPTELGLLSSIQVLGIEYTNVTGNFPSQLGQLDNLLFMMLANSKFQGTIPDEIFNLTNLHYLQLSQFTNDASATGGSLPTEIGQLTCLVALYLNHAQLNGPIPSEIGHLTNLEMLDISYNFLTSGIPSTVSTLKHLFSMYLQNNVLSGSIPSLGEINLSGNLSADSYTADIQDRSARRMWLYDNQLTGHIPEWLPSEAEDMDFHRNLLTGSLPTEIGTLSRLEILEIDTNDFQGPIPSEFGRLTNLKWILAENNGFSGSIPSELGDLQNITWIALDNNQLNSSLPKEIFQWDRIRRFSASKNSLTGSIHGDIIHWADADIVKIVVSSNNISGALPMPFCSIPSLHFECFENYGCGCFDDDGNFTLSEAWPSA